MDLATPGPAAGSSTGAVRAAAGRDAAPFATDLNETNESAGFSTTPVSSTFVTG